MALLPCSNGRGRGTHAKRPKLIVTFPIHPQPQLMDRLCVRVPLQSNPISSNPTTNPRLFLLCHLPRHSCDSLGLRCRAHRWSHRVLEPAECAAIVCSLDNWDDDAAEDQDTKRGPKIFTPIPYWIAISCTIWFSSFCGRRSRNWSIPGN